MAGWPGLYQKPVENWRATFGVLKRPADAVKGERGLVFERGLYSLADYPLKPATEMSGWRAALLQNQQLAGQAVQMLAFAENIQIRGGIGFTWEHPAHLYFKRAKSSELLFGDPTYHRELLAHRIGI